MSFINLATVHHARSKLSLRILAQGLPHAVGAEVFLKDLFNLGLELGVTFRTIRETRRVRTFGHMIIESCRGNRQLTADWLDPVIGTVICYELDYRLNGGRALPVQNMPTL